MVTVVHLVWIIIFLSVLSLSLYSLHFILFTCCFCYDLFQVKRVNVCSTKGFNLLYTLYFSTSCYLLWLLPGTNMDRCALVKLLTVQDVKVHLDQTKYQMIYYMFKWLSAPANYVWNFHWKLHYNWITIEALHFILLQKE